MALTLDGTAGITANPGTVTVTSGTFTTSTPAVNTTQTWNASGVTFTGWKVNITDTASASGSLLADLQVGGSSKFSVRKDGAALASDGTVGSPGITFASDTDSGLYRIGANNIGIGVNGAKVLDIGTTGLGVTGTLTSAEQTVTATSTTGIQINQSAAAQQGLGVLVSNSSYAGTAFYVNSTRAANSAFELIRLAANAAVKFRVYGDGSATLDASSSSSSGLIISGSSGYGLQCDSASGTAQSAIFTKAAGTGSTVDIWSKATSGDNGFLQFFTEGTPSVRGSITYNRGGGVTAFNTTSDYRAKTIYGPLTDTGATIDALKVYRGKMNGATIERPMMIAHEAQEVVPYAVNGEKDELDEKGNPKYQTMDHQILVPLLIAEVQALRARVAALEAK